MKDFFLKNKTAAAVCLALVIVLSLVGGTARSVSGEKRSVEKAYKAQDEFGESVRDTLESLAYHANSFQSSYISALGSDELSEKLNTAIRCVEQVAADTPAGLYSHCKTISQVSGDMYSALMNADLYSGNVRSAYAALDNDISILKNYTEYNEAAERYNSIAASFPASLFGFGRAAYFG